MMVRTTSFSLAAVLFAYGSATTSCIRNGGGSCTTVEHDSSSLLQHKATKSIVAIDSDKHKEDMLAISQHSLAGGLHTGQYSHCRHRVYFFLEAYESPQNAHYSHMTLSLGEGLRNLTCYFRANIDFWKSNGGDDFLFQQTDENPLEFDAIVVPYPMADKLPKHVQIKKDSGPIVVMLDWSDGDDVMQAKERTMYDLYYRASYSLANMPMNPQKPLLPSAFYLTNHVIHAAATAAQRVHGARKLAYMWPHSEVMHPLRRFMQKHLLSCLTEEKVVRPTKKEKHENDTDYYLWSHTGRRYDSEYYEMMQQAQLMDVTGGYWKGDYIFQWDSFKLWEAFASGIAVVMPDLETYGARLPVMPSRFVHYIPVTLEESSITELCHRISGKLEGLNFTSIGDAGRAWALQHYSPTAFAERFIEDAFNDA